MPARLRRRVLVDIARSKRYQKRGGGAVRITFTDALAVTREAEPDLAEIDEVLQALGEVDERKARVVELRFFGGLTVEETASVLDISVQTVIRDWKFAKVWLSKELRGRSSKGNAPRSAITT
jgi:RNA polymerase sigma factor (TIGR02999 family)